MNKKLPEKLQKLISSKNIVDDLDEETLTKIAQKVSSGYNEDKQSMSKWLMKVEDAQRLAKLEREPKNWPRPDAANIKFPLITAACDQFAARALPMFLNQNRPCKSQIYGISTPFLEDKAWRQGEFVNWQLCGKDSSWVSSMDKMLAALPNIGFLVKKTFYNTTTEKIESFVCHYKDIVMRNGHEISCLDDIRRITHDLHLYTNDLIEGVNYDLYSASAVRDIMMSLGTDVSDLDKPLLIHEQHRFLDLDEDGYEEPYIVTQDGREGGTNKIIRIIARFDEEDVKLDKEGNVACITPIQFFTDFHCLRASDGSFMSEGFGTLLLHLNESINTILNELVDAGALANMQTGVIDSRLKLIGGEMLSEPGMWHRVKGVYGMDLEKGILPIQYKEPSQVLFNLLGLLIEAGQQLVSANDIMNGSANPQNSPAASVMTLAENGMKLENSIHCRIHHSLAEEFKKIFRLNQKYLDPIHEENVLGINISRNDFTGETVQIIPAADPMVSSDMQRIARIQFIVSLLQQPTIAGYINIPALLARGFKDFHMEEYEDLINKQPPKPDPKAIAAQAHAQAQTAKVQLAGREQDRKDKEFVANLSKMQADIDHLHAKSIELLSQASKNRKESDVNEFNAHVGALKSKMDAAAVAHKQMSDSIQQQQKFKLDVQKQAFDHLHAVQDQKLDAIQQVHDMAHQNIDAAHRHIELKQVEKGLDHDQQRLELEKKAFSSDEEDQTPDEEEPNA